MDSRRTTLGPEDAATRFAAVADNTDTSQNAVEPDTVELARERDQDAEQGGRRAHGTWRIGDLSKDMKQNSEKVCISAPWPGVLTHVLQHVSHVTWEDPVSHVTYGEGVGGFASLHDSGHVRLYLPDGRVREPSLQPARVVSYQGLCSTQLPGRVVGWGPGATLTLLDMELQPVAQAQEALDVRACQTIADTLELVTVGAGNVCVWSLRHMVCRVRVVEGLGRRSVFTLLALAPPTPHMCPRALAASRRAIALVDLAEGRVLQYKNNLHTRDITGLVYCPLQEAVVTASRDKTIRVWGSHWELLMVFIGHTAVVSSLLLCPVSGLLVSCSLDGTLRCWSLEEGDQVQAVALPTGSDPPLGMGGPSPAHTFFSFSRTGLNFWTFRSLCRLHCRLSADSSGPVRQISAPASPRPYPAWVLCVHGDSDVTLVSVETGTVLTAFRAKRRVRCADYCLHREILLVLTEEGTVILTNSLSNPAVQLDEWYGEQQGDWSIGKKQEVVEPARCMALYSNISDPQRALEEWRALQDQRGFNSNRRNLQGDAKNRFLVMLGHQGGCVSVIQMHSGNVQCRISAHNGQNINSIQAYPENDCLLTTGEDDSVLLWRVFLYAQECVSVQASVFCAHTPVCVALLDSVLAVCLQQHHSATYCLVQYNLHTNTRMDHPPEHDHSSTITGLCVCQKLRVFISCSLDGTVRIWDEENHLLRTLELSVECVQFSVESGQLLLGIRGDLHTLNNTHLLDHQLELICNEHPVSDPPISYTTTKSVKHQPESSPLSRMNFPEKQKEINDPDWECVVVRGRDLQSLQSGEIQHSRARKRPGYTQREAFTRYIQLLYHQPLGIHLPEEDPFDPLTVLCPPKPSDPRPLTPPPLQGGFFPNRKQAKECDEVRSAHPRQSAPGFIPNSVLAGRLWPDRAVKDAPPPKAWTLREDLDYDVRQSEMHEALDDEQFDWVSPVHILETPPKPQSPTPPPSPALPSTPTITSTPTNKVKYTLKALKPHPPIKKATPPTPQSPPLSPPKPATLLPPCPSSPLLPHFLCQFLQEQWFHAVYPDRGCIPETLSAAEFCVQLLDFLKCCSVEQKIHVQRAIITLHTQGLLDNTQHITHSLLTLLHSFLHSNMGDEEQRFVAELLIFLVRVDPHSYDITVELLTLLVNKELRLQGMALSMLQTLGMDDTQRWIPTRVENWLSGTQGQENLQQALREAAHHWLHRWAEQYRVQKRPALVQDAGGKSVVAPADVLRYFCWVQREVQRQPPPPPPGGRKDTVLLKTQAHRWEAVQRLGETYTMSRLREPRGLVLPPLVSQPLLTGFTRLLHLPLPRVTLSSFPLSLAPHSLRGPSLQRFFFLERSYVQSYR